MTNESAQSRSISSIVHQHRLREVLEYDLETGIFKWRSTGKVAGTGEDYIKIQVDGQRYAAHTLAWYYVYGVFTLVDHKDRVGSHNWIENLRPVTYQQNAANREAQYNNSGAKGVYKRGNKYHAGIKVNQIRIHLGTFWTLEEASNAYKNAATYYFGEFANA